MAQQQRRTAASTFSTPVIAQTFEVKSQQAQYLLQEKQGFRLVVRAFYSISVILRIIGSDDEMDALEEVLDEKLRAIAAEVDGEIQRLQVLVNSVGGVDAIVYTHPKTVEVQISSPQLAQYIALIRKVDEVNGLVDSLWLGGHLTSKQKKTATFKWRRLVYSLGREIFELGKRAREGVERRGMGDEFKAEHDERQAEVRGSLMDEDDGDDGGEQKPETSARPSPGAAVEAASAVETD